MSSGDSFDTFSGPAPTYGDGSGRYRAVRVTRNALATTHPGAVGIADGTGAPISVGDGDIKVAELLSRPEAVELQVFVIQIEGGDEFVALADRAEVVNYPPQHAALRVSDWGEAHGPSVLELLDQVPFDHDADLKDAATDDRLRRTAADREQSGRHAHQPSRRPQTSSQGGRVG